jgi:hypothetical protein
LQIAARIVGDFNFLQLGGYFLAHSAQSAAAFSDLSAEENFFLIAVVRSLNKTA